METRPLKKFWKSARLYFLFGLAVVAFAMFGLLPNQMTGAAGGMAATVNGKSISVGQFARAMENVEQQRRGQFDNLSPSDRAKEMAKLRRDVARQLVGNEVMYQATKNNGIWVAESELRDTIKELSYFKVDGQFDPLTYKKMLKQSGQAPGEFEENVRHEVAVNHLRQLFSVAFKTPKQETELENKIRDTYVNVEYVEFSDESLPSELKPSHAEVQAYVASANGSTAVKAYYESHRPQFVQSEAVRARHILIKASPKEAVKMAEARKKIEDLRRQVLDGADMATLAKKFSEDEGTKPNGGDLGFFGRGRMVPEFDQAAFQQKIGDVGEIVQTQYGFHFLRVEEKRAALTKELKDVQTEIAEKLVSRDKLIQVRSALRDELTKMDRAALDSWVKTKGFIWKETGEISLARANIPGFPNQDQFLKVLGSLKKPGEFAKTIVEGESKSYVVALKAMTTKPGPDLNLASGFDFMSMFRLQSIFRAYQDQLSTEAKIDFNPQIIGSTE